ncbi:hypothetical protein SAMN05216276_101236 [Streptosporangium subroseum]|uniref:Uncharacterized protein n=1 Tax=Streptosporangium subroseum TaxID=106412 RepID=A0A239FQJ2_9ACTN|nr:hypothetical protein SAMN05216276_101236 [Streptosporangium subroseum]
MSSRHSSSGFGIDRTRTHLCSHRGPTALRAQKAPGLTSTSCNGLPGPERHGETYRIHSHDAPIRDYRAMPSHQIIGRLARHCPARPSDLLSSGPAASRRPRRRACAIKRSEPPDDSRKKALEGKDHTGRVAHHARVAEGLLVSDGPPVPDAGRGRFDGVVIPAAELLPSPDPVGITLGPVQQGARLGRTRVRSVRRVAPEPDDPRPERRDRRLRDGQRELLRPALRRTRVRRPRRSRRSRVRPRRSRRVRPRRSWRVRTPRRTRVRRSRRVRTPGRTRPWWVRAPWQTRLRRRRGLNEMAGLSPLRAGWRLW